MTKLEKLYSIIENSREVGVSAQRNRSSCALDSRFSNSDD